MRNANLTSMLAAALVLAACGQSSTNSTATSAGTAPEPSAAPAATKDPCTLVADANATFGQPVTASVSEDLNQPKACNWTNAEGRLCGRAQAFGPGWYEVPDLSANYTAMTTSLAAFGKLYEVAGLGEEARGVDGGILGTQIAVRTPRALALVASACNSGSMTQSELAEKLAREVVGRL